MTEILAICNLDQQPVHEEMLVTMMHAISDQANQGIELSTSGNIGLACQYFWLTPQETGEKQPIWDPTGKIAIIGSIRLDNRDELAERFKVDQKTRENISDLSLVLLAYHQWGLSSPDHLLGDYAFIIWDKNTQYLFLVRDALGVKNLAYIFHHNTFIAASEIDLLLAYPEMQFTVNEGKLADILAGNFYDQNESCYREIQYLSPAHAMLISSEGIKKWCYWKINPESSFRYKHEEEYAQHLKEIFTTCVQDRLRTVGPVGISMSGGLDSPSVAAIVSQILPTPYLDQESIATYSYAFDQVISCDERAYIEHMLRAFPLSPHFVFCDHQWTLRDLNTWPVYREYPASDPYPRLPLSVMKAAQQDGIKLLLSGYFGDTLFTGQSYWLTDLIRHTKYALIHESLNNGQLKTSKAQAILHSGLLPLIPRSWKNFIYKLTGHDQKIPNKGLHPEFIRRTQLKERLRNDDRWKEFHYPGQWDRLSRLTLNIYSQGHATVSKEYHRHGMEISTPYWDRRLVEFVMALPAYQLGRPGIDRYVMRNAMRGLVPEPIRLRTQRTIFSELFTMGIFDKEKETVKRLIKDALIVQLNIIKHDWFQAEFEAGTKWSADGYYFWKALSLELWLRKVYNVPLPD